MGVKTAGALEDRVPDKRILPYTGPALRDALRRTQRDLGVRNWSPYQLRHRRISVWHREGIPFVEIAHRVGHSRTSLTADVYSHVLVDDEGQ